MGYYFHPDFRTDLEYIQYSPSERKQIATLTLLGRYFVGNSLNITAGIGVGRQQENIYYTILRNPLTYTWYRDVAYRDVKTINAALGIGNEWHWQNFKFGILWFGGYWHMARTIKITNGPDGIDDQSDRDLGGLFLSRAINFSLGFSL